MLIEEEKTWLQDRRDLVNGRIDISSDKTRGNF